MPIRKSLLSKYLALCALVFLLYSSCTGKAGGNSQSAGLIREITSSKEFSRIVDKNEGKLIAFDMYAVWCAPCYMLTPVLEKLAADNKDKITFYRVNVDKLFEIADMFKVKSIPFVVFMKNKQVIAALTGAQSAEQYQDIINGVVPLPNTAPPAGPAVDNSSGDQSFSSISGSDAQKLISADKPFILDVRTPKEYNSGHIAGATLIPVYELTDRIGEITAHKTQKVLVYCYSGNRSLAASQVLLKHGFNQVINLKGGTMDWKRSGFPLETSSEQTGTP
jgi:thioredoxin